MKNPTLFGLKTNLPIKIFYNASTGNIEEVIGLEIEKIEDILISEKNIFNIPQSISIYGIGYYPSKYEFSSGLVSYHSKIPPYFPIKTKDGCIEDVKVMRARITLAMLNEYNKSAKKRPRKPNQNQVMGESAKDHVEKLISNGTLIINENTNIKWQWCHLIAFTMLPTKRAQSKKNFIAGTDACNGHMSNIEEAVKSFIYKTGRDISVEVTATIVYQSELGIRIRYRIYEPRSKFSFVDVFDALTHVRSDHADFENILDKLMTKYQKLNSLP